MSQDERARNAEGMAALAICEALLLALSDLKIMSVKQVRNVLDDAAAAHRDAAASTGDAALQREILDHIKRIKSSVQTIARP